MQLANVLHIAYSVENMAQQKCIILSEVSTQQLKKWNCLSKKYTGTPIKTDKLPRKSSVKRLLFVLSYGKYRQRKLQLQSKKSSAGFSKFNDAHESMPECPKKLVRRI
ncbi:unnamed protein product [Euphydryas editha]|uniref:Uncharacterized protein n=1 Tax=Euphydryas editha TaxID=104508 RepID=A0AAU9U806_EUPED|nr:unnamed protein product [Euphydryas editha]